MANWENAPVVDPAAKPSWQSAPVVASGDNRQEQSKALQDQSRRQFLNSVPLVGPAVNTAIDFGPKAVESIAQSIGDAIMLPMDVMTNKGGINDPTIDPETGRVMQSSDALLERTVNAAGVMTPGSRVPGAPKVPSPALREADDLGIPLTRGQRTGSLKQLTKEEGMRQQDGPAQNIVRRFDERQREAIAGATDEIGRKMGGDAANMADLVTTKVRDKVGFSKERAGSLYDIAFNGDLVVKKEALEGGLPGAVHARLADEARIVDPTLTPSAAMALQEIEAAGRLEGALRPMAPKAGAPAEDITGVSLRGVDQVRRRIINLEGVNDTDRAALGAIKRSFDGWLDDAVDNVLITGDDAALKALKEARAETQVYKSITSPKPGDSVGKSVSNLLREETTAEEVANWLYGADVVSPSLNAPKVAARVRNTLGVNSPEWAAVRTAAWQRLTKDMGSGDVRTPTMLVKRIEGFLNNRGSSLARILYTPAEQQHMLELVRTLKRTITPRDATNPSRSGHVVANLMDGMMRLIAIGTGLALGDVTTAIVAPIALSAGKNAMRTGAAKGAVKQVGALKPIPGANAAPSLLLREKLLETEPKRPGTVAPTIRLEA